MSSQSQCQLSLNAAITLEKMLQETTKHLFEYAVRIQPHHAKLFRNSLAWNLFNLDRRG
ncbi:hypothetical protein [Cyanobacterium sp. uoEpiScrs1]|uniref:hypothetical protein n=1 Tax=Cyanobacterium sp. uoEpiScrs1 TaxID=2976343 RepID=UPI002269DF48|nr:hypothetical protein [Cyanobacterium sp. uoEpiScrs1]